MNTAVQSAGVLSFEDAYEAVRAYCLQLLKAGDRPSEEVLLLQSAGRVLAEPIKADRNFPPFPRATRDGFAVWADDLARGVTLLRVVGQVRAGDSYDLPVGSGEAVEIMTGAAVPAGADAVVMVEYTERRSVPGIDRKEREGTPRESQNRGSVIDDDRILDIAGHAQPEVEEKRTEDIVEIQRAVASGENVVPAGAEAQAGQELLPLGVGLGAAQIALAAAAGKA